MQFVQMGSVGMKKKKVPILRRGLFRKKKSYASAIVAVLTDKVTL